ncbi:hypothetical protein Dda_5538 [Drechslerella dactyloides]|uniref:Uncharacterized protein n=1 Tax=Drechslerella dactyloides TaxID=74499 RepID=A0AAD6IXP5_DREDA|nr:hypothetical protein Dda_5538 [Drechslerella dactyloides]
MEGAASRCLGNRWKERTEKRRRQMSPDDAMVRFYRRCRGVGRITQALPRSQTVSPRPEKDIVLFCDGVKTTDRDDAK